LIDPIFSEQPLLKTSSGSLEHIRNHENGVKESKYKVEIEVLDPWQSVY
jgi:hypothetical protein